MADLSKKKESDLQKELVAKRKALHDFRFGMAGSKTRNVKEGRELRKDIARIKTELSRRHNVTA